MVQVAETSTQLENDACYTPAVTYIVYQPRVSLQGWPLNWLKVAGQESLKRPACNNA
jgi:hypothetical protein